MGVKMGFYNGYTKQWLRYNGGIPSHWNSVALTPHSQPWAFYGPKAAIFKRLKDFHHITFEPAHYEGKVGRILVSWGNKVASFADLYTKEFIAQLPPSGEAVEIANKVLGFVNKSTAFLSSACEITHMPKRFTAFIESKLSEKVFVFVDWVPPAQCSEPIVKFEDKLLLAPVPAQPLSFAMLYKKLKDKL